MKEDMEARAQELDPTRSKTIGSYVIGTHRKRQERRWERGLLGRLSRLCTSLLGRKWQSRFCKKRRLLMWQTSNVFLERFISLN